MESITKPVKYAAPTVGIVSIMSRVARAQRQIAKRRINWPMDRPGDGNDYRLWACHSMGHILRQIAENLDCQVPDTEIGIATHA